MEPQIPPTAAGQAAGPTAVPMNTAASIPGPAPFSPGFHIEGAKRQILGAIRARDVTDRKIPEIWVIIPLLIIIAGVVIGGALMFMSMFDHYYDMMNGIFTPDILGDMLFGMMIIIITEIIALVIFGILAYMLVERQNEHFQREAQLRMGVLSYLRAAAGSPEREASMAVEIATINSLQVQAVQAERPHSAIGWALFVVLGFWIPVVNLVMLLYLFYFLMENISSHDVRWNMFWQQTGSAMNKLGHNTDPRMWYTAVLPHRSFALYLVLSIITFGLFAFYWGYILIKDPNDHFRSQAYYEDLLAGMISQ